MCECCWGQGDFELRPGRNVANMVATLCSLCGVHCGENVANMVLALWRQGGKDRGDNVGTTLFTP